MKPKGWIQWLWDIVLITTGCIQGYAILHQEWVLLALCLSLVCSIIMLKSVMFSMLNNISSMKEELEVLKTEVRQLQDTHTADWKYPSESRETTKLY